MTITPRKLSGSANDSSPMKSSHSARKKIAATGATDRRNCPCLPKRSPPSHRRTLPSGPPLIGASCSSHTRWICSGSWRARLASIHGSYRTSPLTSTVQMKPWPTSWLSIWRASAWGRPVKAATSARLTVSCPVTLCRSIQVRICRCESDWVRRSAMPRPAATQSPSYTSRSGELIRRRTCA